MHSENIARMNDPQLGMDIVIISTSSLFQKQEWETRLKLTRREVLKPEAQFFVVHEDWQNGAGNLLGTLYAFLKASQEEPHLLEKMAAGASVAIYHTAGQGKRLWPLAGSELGNKSFIKLPQVFARDNAWTLTTLLESVIKQTSIYSTLGKGRLSVFWGDQIFIPALAVPDSLSSHIANFIMKIPLPDKAEWERRKIWQYGTFMTKHDGEHIISEKIDFETLQMLSQAYRIQPEIGLNLGSFSLSLEMLMLLLAEYEQELQEKHTHLDVEAYLWMPLTHEESIYDLLMQQKQVAEANAYYQRVRKLKQKLSPNEQLYAGIDVGQESYWWDYGSVQSYYHNNMKLLGQSDESQQMRAFFQVPAPKSDLLLINCEIEKLDAKNCVLIDVKADSLVCEDSLLIDVSGKNIKAIHTLMYHIEGQQRLNCPKDTVLADIENIRLTTNLWRDGKEDWDTRLEGNSASYAELAGQMQSGTS